MTAETRRLRAVIARLKARRDSRRKKKSKGKKKPSKGKKKKKTKKKRTKKKKPKRKKKKKRKKKTPTTLYFVLDVFTNMFTIKDFRQVQKAIAKRLGVGRKYLRIKMFPGSVILKVVISKRAKRGLHRAKAIVSNFTLCLRSAVCRTRKPFKLAKFSVQSISFFRPISGKLDDEYPKKKSKSKKKQKRSTSRPTAGPTKRPTVRPTARPTKTPTFSKHEKRKGKTGKPTISPTRTPTMRPTAGPSRTPTHSRAPTRKPTGAPLAPGSTHTPTRKPTRGPTLPFPTSCQELHDRKHPTGFYKIKLKGAKKPEMLHCLMRGGTGWTLVSRVTSSGDKWSFAGDNSQTGNFKNSWEDKSTFGRVGSRSDYKARAYGLLSAKEVLITKAVSSDIVAETNGNCLGSLSLQGRFNALRWQCPNNAKLGTNRCAHACSIIPDSNYVKDKLFNGLQSEFLYLQAGEKTGTKSRKSRVYLSSSAARARTPSLKGLGTYCSGKGCGGKKKGGSWNMNGTMTNKETVYNMYVGTPRRSMHTKKSCQHWRDVGYTKSGGYLIRPNSQRPSFVAHCRMEEKVGWTMVGRISSRGKRWSFAKDKTKNGKNVWEDTSIFGKLDGKGDYKSPAWELVEAEELKITRGNDKTVIVETAGDCLEDKSLGGRLRALRWMCSDKEQLGWEKCAQACSIAHPVNYAKDEVLDGHQSELLYLQAGVEDIPSNPKEKQCSSRVYISASAARSTAEGLHGLGVMRAGTCKEVGSFNSFPKQKEAVTYELFVGTPPEPETKHSCEDWRKAGAKSGRYFIKPKHDEPPVLAVCKMWRGHAWTMVARVSSSGKMWSFPDDQSTTGKNVWESKSVFGTEHGIADYKSSAYSWVGGKEVMITKTEPKKRAKVMLVTSGNCLGGASMRVKLKSVSWMCKPKTSLLGAKKCVAKCRIQRFDYPADKNGVINGKGDFLFFQAGTEEKRGEPARRVYLSTSGTRKNVEDLNGLGTYCRGKCKERSRNVGAAKLKKAATYTVWVSTSPKRGDENMVRGAFSLQFDGTKRQFVKASAKTAGAIRKAFTISAWIRTKASRYQAIVGQRKPGCKGGYLMHITKKGRLAFFISDSKHKNGWGGQSKTSVNDGKWHHVAAVQDPWSKGGRIYIDGIRQPNIKIGKFNNKNGVRAVECGAPVVGRDLKTNKMQFKGKIDEVSIWRRSFTSKEVEKIAGGRDANNAERLLLHYRFDTGKGSVAADSSLNSFPGTITGKPKWSKGLTATDTVSKFRKTDAGRSKKG